MTKKKAIKMAEEETMEQPQTAEQQTSEGAVSSPSAEIAEAETRQAEIATPIETLDIDSLRRELEETKAKANEYLDGWQRARAELINYKKRLEREQALAYQNAVGNVIKRYLPIIDDLERAIQNRAMQDNQAWADGIELIYRKMLAALEADGVTVLQAEGQPFDPNFHEAISMTPSEEHESGQIIEVLQKGYMLGDRVLRPALVRVAQ